jgi:hypothetical protein
MKKFYNIDTWNENIEDIEALAMDEVSQCFPQLQVHKTLQSNYHRDSICMVFIAEIVPLVFICLVICPGACLMPCWYSMVNDRLIPHLPME